MGTRVGTDLRKSDGAGIISQRRNETYEFAGSEDALYERHLAFDNIVDLEAIDARERFEAFARAGARRSFASAGWKPKTPMTRQDPKRIYYLRWSFSSAGRWPTT